MVDSPRSHPTLTQQKPLPQSQIQAPSLSEQDDQQQNRPQQPSGAKNTPPPSKLANHRSPRQPKILAKACLLCRSKKIRCDVAHPSCSACVSQGRECVYRNEAPRKRPTFSQIIELQRANSAFKKFILKLKESSPEERERLLAETTDPDGSLRTSTEESGGEREPENPVPNVSTHEGLNGKRRHPPYRGGAGISETPIVSSDDELDIAHFISVDDAGGTSSFGPSSALHNPAKSDTGLSPSRASGTTDNVRNSLIANAALQRHQEHALSRNQTIDGVPSSLALHLLNLHWARQHHTFLLTYRPAIMRDLQCSGPNCSIFLLNAIFACVSKFSPEVEAVRYDVNDPATAGRRFFRRCDELLIKGSLLTKPHITTVIGLLLLGSTFNARGETSKGWLYTGYALRMVYDLGLHLDPKGTTDNPEEVEIRRRVFWGAFVCDKLQSLYLGRPVAINLRDSRVSREFLDTYEENEPFSLCGDRLSPKFPSGAGDSVPIHSVSTFQQLCLLSKIMTTIINRFYVVGATFSNAQNSLQQVNAALQKWKEDLSPELDFQPWLSTVLPTPLQPPNVMILHNLYHSLIILVHRPFISDGHLRSAATPAHSWERCTVAASCITSISLTYKSAYGLLGAPYVLGYTIYVACTIHVRNAAMQDSQQSAEHLSLLKSTVDCLDELCLANPGVAKAANIIKHLVKVNNLDLNIDENRRFEHQALLNFDLDALINTFPMTNNAEADMAMPMGLDYMLPPDPLFGLMGGAGMPFDFQPSNTPPYL
ncbi:unnamed protein product [Clonostachys rosea]|uniref:Zn(2)-C6 fungal-type domain-containing protein n=1 Tax=Bionectria ochroleuca TaxID=29856 RepID=A0ABY6UMG9_BIOOC|nr:unnamed protein product [Clonostachys rosea]